MIKKMPVRAHGKIDTLPEKFSPDDNILCGQVDYNYAITCA